eukprot:TRINITY_DN15308_c0_g1_i1.p1 TRINITY_DN15308_c0_g1~~TRINITY_DN15308_c0_g1_i1.p1  ORF type:complete len:196 (+),score=38.63 TRINITY_DN15308_c0_g1_i1:111-698(+)
MIRRPPRSTQGVSSAASDVYKRQVSTQSTWMLGRRPYSGRSRKEIHDQVLSTQAQVKVQELPSGWSISSANFVNKLLRRKPTERLGVKGPEEVKSHPWLKDVSWKELAQKKLTPRFIPDIKRDNFDPRSINQAWRDNEDTLRQNALLLSQPSVQALFNGYYYDSSVLKKMPDKLASLEQMSASSQATADTKNVKK